jgi:hypothetical protein
MKRGPQPGSGTTDFAAKARAAWPDPLPAEVLALADACNASTASAVAARIGYSPAVVSHVLSAKYRGDMTAVFARIRGALMAETVACPVLGEIGTDRCLIEQRRPFAATNSTRARLFHACKTCPNRRNLMTDPMEAHDAP